MRLLLSGTENYSQSLGTSLHSLFLSHLSEHSALAALPRADQSAANGSPVLCHSSAGSLKSIRRFMVDLERGKKTHLQARSYFLRLPFCSLCAEDKGGSGWRWGTGSGGDEIPRNKSSRSYAQWERIWGGGEHRNCALCSRAAVSVGQEPLLAAIRGEGMRWKFSCRHQGAV